MYERLVALDVVDDSEYQAYRDAMTPILEEHGGAFGYDFRVSEVLRSEADHRINRVFTIRFPDQEASERFFAGEDYRRIRRTHFDPAVEAITVIAAYER